VTRFGYFLSSEKYDPGELVRQARLAEQAGFDALWISDHFHPWLDDQGESGFVWSVIRAISQSVSLPVTTAVMPDAEMARLYREDMISGPCGPDAGEHRNALSQFADAGFDEVYVDQAGGAPEAFFEFYAEQVLPAARGN
jgi:Luciferase-like monooxygenase